MIPAELVEKALAADLVLTAERLGVTLKSGKPNERVGRCPACQGFNQFCINVKRETWACFGCGRGGSNIDLVRQAYGFSFRQAVEFLADSD